MTRRHQSSSVRDPEKEAFWREALKRWRQSKLNQAEFCRQENLNQNTFSSWKTTIVERDAELEEIASARNSSTKQRHQKAQGTLAKFVRLDFAETQASASKPTGDKVQNAKDNGHRNSSAVLAAELLVPAASLRLLSPCLP